MALGRTALARWSQVLRRARSPSSARIPHAAVVLAAVLSACGGGSLDNEPTSTYVDFEYQAQFTQPYAALEGPVALRSRFVWDGPSGQEITAPQHTVLAFTQSGDPGNTRNEKGQVFWTHGAGAFVGQRGLSLEMWFRDDPGMDGYQNDPPNAIAWSQDFGRCGRDVRGTIAGNAMCLDVMESLGGYITAAPNFVLRKGVAYFLTVRLEPAEQGMLRLKAELYEESGELARPVQKAMALIPQSRAFPLQGQPLQASVARTPGSPSEPTVQYVMF